MILTPEKPERSEWKQTSHVQHRTATTSDDSSNMLMVFLFSLSFLPPFPHPMCTPQRHIFRSLSLFPFPLHSFFSSCMFFLFSVVITADGPGGKMVTPTQHFNYWYVIRYFIHQESYYFAKFIQHMMMIPCKKAAKRSARFGGPEWHTTKKEKSFSDGKKKLSHRSCRTAKKNHNSQRKSSPSSRACYMKTNR